MIFFTIASKSFGKACPEGKATRVRSEKRTRGDREEKKISPDGVGKMDWSSIWLPIADITESMYWGAASWAFFSSPHKYSKLDAEGGEVGGGEGGGEEEGKWGDILSSTHDWAILLGALL